MHRINMLSEGRESMKDGRERYDMCKAFEDMRLEGYEAGIEKVISILIQT